MTDRVTGGKADLPALSAELDKALYAYLDAIGRGPGGEVEKRTLAQILWDDKSTIASLLRRHAQGPLDLQGAASFVDELIGEDCTVEIRKLVSKTILGVGSTSAFPSTLLGAQPSDPASEDRTDGR